MQLVNEKFLHVIFQKRKEEMDRPTSRKLIMDSACGWDFFFKKDRRIMFGFWYKGPPTEAIPNYEDLTYLIFLPFNI